jgi:GT2 family glycosyltransferase
MPKWSVQPDEVVIVDDGSDEPFACEDSSLNGAPLRIIRLPDNRGFFVSKSIAYSEASGDVILAADCDARLSARFLEYCLTHLKNPKTGMVTGARVQDVGHGPVGEFLRMFGDNYRQDLPGPVDFIPAIAFAMRSNVWREIGGFGDRTAGIGEDHVLCGRVKARGYALVCDPRIFVNQVRRLDRIAVCRRYWRWLSGNAMAFMRRTPSLPEGLYGCFVQPMLRRIEISVRRDAPASVYVDMLYVTSHIALTCQELEASGDIAPGCCLSFLRRLEEKLRPWPVLARLLKADLLRVGVAWPHPAPNATPAVDWDAVLVFLEICAESKLFDWLNADGVRHVLEEEAEGADFSAYR